MAARLKIKPFNSYVSMAFARLNSESARLGVSPAKLADLAALIGSPATKGTWRYLWPQYTKKGTCTSVVRQQIKDLRRKIEKLLSEIYNDIPVSVWNVTDRGTFGRKTGDRAKPTKPGNISDICVVAFQHIGGGRMKVICKTAHDSSRASVAKNANGLQFYYEIFYHRDSIADSEGHAQHDRLRSPEDCSCKMFSSSAKFLLELGAETAGRYIVYFARWYNSKHPRIAGPWMGPAKVNVL